MDIIACLTRYPWRSLKALAAVYGLPAHHRHLKEQVGRALAAAIHARLPQTLAALDADARAALRALAGARDLSVPQSDFVARFGALHPYRPWDPRALPAPWPTPTSPAATLVHYGLAYPLDLGARQRSHHVVLLPHDLRDALVTLLDLPVTPAPDPPVPPPTPEHGLDADLFALLSFLNRQDCPVRHGRWLRPRTLQALNAVLSPPDDLGDGRSELQAARIPFLHYLAERAGLVGLTGGCLKPTLVAQEWLAAPRSQRLCILWDAWREPVDDNRALWRRYRLPALEEDDDPLARLQALFDALAACPVGPPGDPTGLLEALIERAPALVRPQATYAAWAALDPDERAGFEARARAVLLVLLTGPLTWFGLLSKSANQQIGKSANQQIGKSANQQSPLLLTPLGAALLGREDGIWPIDSAPVPLHVAVDEAEGPAVLLDAPALSLADRFALEAIAPPDQATPGRYRLTRSHFLHALQRGHTAEGVANLLERASGEALPAPVSGVLYGWEEEFGRVAVRQVLLLQTRDADLLRDLTARRRIRDTLGKTLNARTVEVRADRLEALLRRLGRRGIVPRLDTSYPHPGPLPGREREEHAHPGPSTGSGQAPLPGKEREEERAAIAVALRVYAHLADALGLPTRPAYALARQWSEGLPLPLRDAVERTVEQTLEALHRAAPLETEDRLPAPTGPLLEALEIAIRERAVVEIEYYTAGRAQRTVRRVEPLRLEWHGEVAYLIAYCHLRGEQRVFRVERIGGWRMEYGRMNE